LLFYLMLYLSHVLALLLFAHSYRGHQTSFKKIQAMNLQ
jgi:hypothetical protein